MALIKLVAVCFSQNILPSSDFLFLSTKTQKGTWSRERAEEEDFKAGEWFELRRLSFGDSAGTNAVTGSDSDNQLIKCVSLSLKRNLEEPGGLLLLGSFVLAELFVRK